jgi:predicted RecB family endonuclease
MSPILQRLMSDLRLLSLEEQWQLLSYLVNQLRTEVVEVDKTPSETSPSKNTTDVDAILQATRGCWGNMSIEEIDAKLDRQRQYDWDNQDVG